MNAGQLKKAKRFIDSTIRKAKQERDRKGYRENLGYDQYNRVDDYLKSLDLSYSEQAALLQTFNRQCDDI